MSTHQGSGRSIVRLNYSISGFGSESCSEAADLRRTYRLLLHGRPLHYRPSYSHRRSCLSLGGSRPYTRVPQANVTHRSTDQQPHTCTNNAVQRGSTFIQTKAPPIAIGLYPSSNQLVLIDDIAPPRGLLPNLISRIRYAGFQISSLTSCARPNVDARHHLPNLIYIAPPVFISLFFFYR